MMWGIALTTENKKKKKKNQFTQQKKNVALYSSRHNMVFMYDNKQTCITDNKRSIKW